MLPTTGTKLRPEVRQRVEMIAKQQGKSVSEVVRDAVMAYLEIPNENKQLPKKSMDILKDALKDPGHPLHDVAYVLMYAPSTIESAYR